MSKNKELIIKCIENLGVYIDHNDLESEDFSDFIEDSLAFISFIVEIEKVFNIEIPDELLMMSNFRDLNQIELLISNLK